MSDQLSQFKNMAPEPKLWDNIDNEIKDERVYDSEGTKAMQESILAQFYGWKKEPDNYVMQIEENQEADENTEVESDNYVMDTNDQYKEESLDQSVKNITSKYKEVQEESFIPLLEWMCLAWELLFEQYDQILVNYIDLWEFNFEEINISPELEQSILGKIESIKTAKDPESEWWKKEYYTDNPEVQRTIDKWEITPIEAEVNNVIWRHYIPLSNNHDEKSLELNKCTSIEMACKDLNMQAKNLKRTTVAYDRAIKDIYLWINSEKKFEWLLSLYTQIWTAEWSVWAKWSKNFQSLMKQWVEKRKLLLQEQYTEIVTSISDNDNKNDKQSLELEKEQIIAEAKEIDSWEVFPATKVDIHNESNKWENKEQIT